MQDVGGGWYRDMEDGYEIQVMPGPAIRNGVRVSESDGYEVKILPSGTDNGRRYQNLFRPQLMGIQ
jgi:hypothetical protein